jgi:ribosomal protein L3 glutamine methyltransferase
MDQSSTSSLYHHLQTFGDWWRYATSAFGAAKLSYGQGFINARDEALFLLQHVLVMPCQEPDWVDSFLNAQLLPHEKSKLNELIQLRINHHMPMCYLVGEAWLQGVKFKCDRRALIPRSLIAELIPDGLDALLDREPSTILDMCCGGGSLAILLAMRFDNASVVAADLSNDALSLARENVTTHQLTHRIGLVETNLFSRMPRQSFDLMVCNPPYVNAKSMRELPSEFLQEPQMALAAGRDGMDLIRRLLSEVPEFLTDNGVLILEIGHEIEHFSKAFPELDVEWLTTSHGDFGVCAIRKIAILSARLS